MTEFKLPNIPDDDIHPLKPDFGWFFKMTGIVLGIFIFSYSFFYGFSYFIVGKLDLEGEKKYFGNLFISDVKKIDISNLGYKLNIPKNIDIYVQENEEVNAFASLGGNIIFTTGLLKELKTKEEFLFILGHEINHIISRDPIHALSTQVPLYLTLTFLGADTSINYEKIFNITSNYNSRKIETRADNAGIQFVSELGLNTNCIVIFFENKDNIFSKYLYINSTHPADKDRIDNIKEQSKNSPNLNKDCSEFEGDWYK